MRVSKLTSSIGIAIAGLLVVVFFISSSGHAGRNNLQVTLKKENVDMVNNTIKFTMNRRASYVEVKVYNLDGELIGERTKYYDSPRAHTPLSIDWPKPIEDAKNFKIELKFVDDKEYWITQEIVSFYGAIPHEEVNFESGKWEILPSEAPKLDAVIPKIIEMINKFKKIGGRMNYDLYVAGHTDTVGPLSENRELSRKRAQSIAKYFLSHGLKKQKINLFVRGFGEESLLIKTGDKVAEKRNRRADYIISNFRPAMAGPGSWVRVK